MTETYVVTGGAGFIGSHIADHLLRQGHRVRIVDNFTTGKRDNLSTLTGELEIFEISITDKDALDKAFVGADYVFHQAALPSVPRSVADPLTTNEMNVTGTLNVLLAARDAGVKRVAYAASSSAYGDVDAEYKTEDLTPDPISPYAVAKLAGEFYCKSFTQVYGLETVALRYFNVFGPRQDETSQYSAVIPKFITAMSKGQSPTVHGDGTQSRDFTFIDNVVHGNLLAIKAPEASGEMMNMATGGRISLLDLIEKINAVLGTNIEPTFTESRKGDVKHSRAGIDKARDLLDFSPVVDFDTGLARTIDWFLKRG